MKPYNQSSITSFFPQKRKRDSPTNSRRVSINTNNLDESREGQDKVKGEKGFKVNTPDIQKKKISNDDDSVLGKRSNPGRIVASDDEEEEEEEEEIEEFEIEDDDDDEIEILPPTKKKHKCTLCGHEVSDFNDLQVIFFIEIMKNLNSI